MRRASPAEQPARSKFDRWMIFHPALAFIIYLSTMLLVLAAAMVGLVWVLS